MKCVVGPEIECRVTPSAVGDLEVSVTCDVISRPPTFSILWQVEKGHVTMRLADRDANEQYMTSVEVRPVFVNVSDEFGRVGIGRKKCELEIA